MEVTFDVNKLDGMKRPELQKLCKEAGIKANMKVFSFLTDRIWMIFKLVSVVSKQDIIIFLGKIESLPVQCY